MSGGPEMERALVDVVEQNLKVKFGRSDRNRGPDCRPAPFVVIRDLRIGAELICLRRHSGFRSRCLKAAYRRWHGVFLGDELREGQTHEPRASRRERASL